MTLSVLSIERDKGEKMEYLSEVKKSQCTARVVAYSISNETNERIITYELDYPRIIHSELMTHRLFNRTGMAGSSRTISIILATGIARELAALRLNNLCVISSL